jgi:hypothetical protein
MQTIRCRNASKLIMAHEIEEAVALTSVRETRKVDESEPSIQKGRNFPNPARKKYRFGIPAARVVIHHILASRGSVH